MMRMGDHGRPDASPRKKTRVHGVQQCLSLTSHYPVYFTEDLVLTYSMIKASNMELQRAQAVGYADTLPLPPELIVGRTTRAGQSMYHVYRQDTYHVENHVVQVWLPIPAQERASTRQVYI